MDGVPTADHLPGALELVRHGLADALLGHPDGHREAALVDIDGLGPEAHEVLPGLADPSEGEPCLVRGLRGDVEDQAAVSIEFANRVTAHHDQSGCSRVPEDSIVIHGTHGSAFVPSAEPSRRNAEEIVTILRKRLG